jgi:subtilisin family serine protease
MSFKQIPSIAIVLLLFAAPYSAAAQTGGQRDSITLSRLPQFLIRFSDTTSRATINQILTGYNARIVDSLRCDGKMILAQLIGTPPPPFTGVIGISEDAKRKAGVSSCEANYASKTPNNLLDTNRYHYSPLPPSCRDTSNVRGRCQQEAGRDSTVIAIIDSGLDGVMQGNTLVPDDPIFNGKLWNDGTGACGFNFLNDTKMPLDTNSHGTHVAGIIQQTIDYYGVRAKLMILKTQDKDGYGTIWDICRAMDYAMCNRANIVNMSLSYTAADSANAPGILEQMISLAGSQYKMLVVTAAGNNAKNVDVANTSNLNVPIYYRPATMKSDNLISVGSTNCLSSLSTYSNYGKISVDIAVQGDSIFSSVLNGRWGFKNGTSMATPFITGTAAMIASRRGATGFNPFAIKEALLQTADNQSFLSSKIVSRGTLNSCNALAYYVSRLPASEARDSVALSRLPQFLIRFSDTSSRATINQILAGYNARVVDSLRCDGKMILAQLLGPAPPPFTGVIGISEDAKRRAGVSGCEPNYAGKLPNNLLDSTRYHYSPLPPSCRDTSNVRGRCQQEAGRDSTIIAIIDSGLDGVMQGNTLVPDDPIFNGRLWNDGTGACGFNFLNDTKSPLDTNSHGTHVAGIIQQTIDYYGVRAKLMILKTQDKDGYGTIWDICRALDYAMCNRANIVNMSLSYAATDSANKPGILEQMINLAGSQYKMLIVAAAGNNSKNVDGVNLSNQNQPIYYRPASMKSDNLISVGATNCLSNISSYSNYGTTSIDLAVQGDSIFSSVLNGRWGFKNGTSMATPFITGTAAVLASRRGTYAFNPYTIKAAILQTVDTQSYLTSRVVKGGTLNACKALSYYATHVTTQEAGNQQVAFKVYPNPFETSVTVEFDLDKTQPVEIIIYNALGQNVLRHSMEGQLGMNQWLWQPNAQQSAGLYHIELRSLAGRKIQKVVRF